jgi:hypothetical protein
MPENNVLGVKPVDPRDSVPFSPGCGVCVGMFCWCRIEEEDNNEKKWEVLRNIFFATCQDEIVNWQVACFTQVKPCCI